MIHKGVWCDCVVRASKKRKVSGLYTVKLKTKEEHGAHEVHASFGMLRLCARDDFDGLDDPTAAPADAPANVASDINPEDFQEITDVNGAVSDVDFEGLGESARDEPADLTEAPVEVFARVLSEVLSDVDLDDVDLDDIAKVLPEDDLIVPKNNERAFDSDPNSGVYDHEGAKEAIHRMKKASLQDKQLAIQEIDANRLTVGWKKRKSIDYQFAWSFGGVVYRADRLRRVNHTAYHRGGQGILTTIETMLNES
jgi:hypothetical protein